MSWPDNNYKAGPYLQPSALYSLHYLRALNITLQLGSRVADNPFSDSSLVLLVPQGELKRKNLRECEAAEGVEVNGVLVI